MSHTLTSRRSRPFFAVGAALLLAGASGLPALAGPADEADSSPTQQPVMLVLDASGSMLQEDAGQGRTRMEAARTALTDLIDAAPEGAELGLMVYGSEVGNSDAEKEAGCQDIRTLSEVGPVDRTALTEAVEAVQASGWTPIGRSLELAAQELPAEGPRSIVLVSDGIDSCGDPDPCEVAEELAADGVDLAIHTVGFRVDDAARAQLQCVADATGGTYADAADAGELTEQMSIQVQRAMRSYVPAGRPVEGGAEHTSPLTLDEGDYVIELTSKDGAHAERSVQHFAVPVHEAERLHISASAIRPQVKGGMDFTWVEVEQVDADGDECRSDRDGNHSNNYMGGPPTATLITTPATAEDGCFPDGHVVFSVTRTGDRAPDGTLPIELSISREAPVEATSVRTARDASLEAPGLGEEEARGGTLVTPGLNYSTATPLEPGTYLSDIANAEFHVYRVHLEPGQKMGAALMPLGDGGYPTSLQLNFAAPDRTALVPDESSSGYRNGNFAVNLTEGEVLADVMRHTVDPARDEQPYQGGDYYLMVSGNFDKEVTVPYALKVEVAGDPLPAPTPLADLVPLSPDASSTDDVASTQVPEADQEGAVTSISPVDEGSDSTTAPADDTAPTGAADTASGRDGDGGPTSAWVWLLGAVGVAVASAGAWLLVRGRGSATS